MTEEELRKIEFRWVSHIALEDRHVTTYENKKYGFTMLQIVTKKSELKWGRALTHYIFKGQIYKSQKKFLEAIKHVPFFKILRNETE